MGIFLKSFRLGKPPFETATYEDTYRRIRAVDLTFPSYLSEEVQDLLRKLLVKDPTKRITLKDVLNHRWIKMHTDPGFKDSTRNSQGEP